MTPGEKTAPGESARFPASPIFGQELYLGEMLRAAEIAAEAGDARPVAWIADGLPQASAHTRLRVARELLRRLDAGSATPAGRAAFVRLVAGLPDTQARRELAFYAVARADALVGALARELLYPVFIENKTPAGYSEGEFAVANAGTLLAITPTLTADFVCEWAARQWDFRSERTVRLALRILRQAGILLSEPLQADGKRRLAYALEPHGLTLSAFVWMFFDAYAAAGPPSLDQAERAPFARTLVVPPSVMGALAREAERAGFVKRTRRDGALRIVLRETDPDALADILLATDRS